MTLDEARREQACAAEINAIVETMDITDNTRCWLRARMWGIQIDAEVVIKRHEKALRKHSDSTVKSL